MNVQVEILEDDGPPVPPPPPLTWKQWYWMHIKRAFGWHQPDGILNDLKRLWSFFVIMFTINFVGYALMVLVILVDVLVRLCGW